jgi:hypothetical protein
MVYVMLLPSGASGCCIVVAGVHVHVFLDFGGIEAIGVFGVGLVVLHAVLCGPLCLSHIGCCTLCGRGALAGYVVDCPCGLEALEWIF